MPQIDDEKCDGCGICVSVCACGVLYIEDNVAKFQEKHEKCSVCERWCGNCELSCPKDAITCPFEIIIEK